MPRSAEDQKTNVALTDQYQLSLTIERKQTRTTNSSCSVGGVAFYSAGIANHFTKPQTTQILISWVPPCLIHALQSKRENCGYPSRGTKREEVLFPQLAVYVEKGQHGDRYDRSDQFLPLCESLGIFLKLVLHSQKSRKAVWSCTAGLTCFGSQTTISGSSRTCR